MNLNMLEKLGDQLFKELENDLTSAMKRIADKEATTSSDIQLVIRYNNPIVDLQEFIKSKFVKYAKDFNMQPYEIQLAIRFRDRVDLNADFFFQVFQKWKPYNEEKVFGSNTDLMTAYCIKRLPEIIAEYKIDSWSKVACMFYLKKEDIIAIGEETSTGAVEVNWKGPTVYMGLMVMEEGKMKLKKEFEFSKESINHPDYFFYEIWKDFKFLRKASFPKDFLGLRSIMPDLKNKETIIKSYLAGINLLGKVMDGQMDKISKKYKTNWQNTAIVFFKDTEIANPMAGIYVKEGPGEFDKKETLNIFQGEAEVII